MQKRRSHTKSRRGCQSCKKQHIKCDEQGPPCANCVARKTECAYAQQPPRPRDADSCTQSDNTQCKPGKSSSTEPSAHSSSSPAPSSAFSDSQAHHPSSQARRLLELELMHRWCTRTYRTFLSMPQDAELLQVAMPQEALLRHEPLLQGLFVLAALDMAVAVDASSSSSNGGSNGSGGGGGGGGGGEAAAMTTTTDAAGYRRAAFEYYGKLIEAFRGQVAHITPANHEVMYVVSSVIAFAKVALLQVPDDDDEDAEEGRPPRQKHDHQTQGKLGSGTKGCGGESSVLEHVAVLCGLFSGATLVGVQGWDLLLESRVPLRAMLALGIASSELIDEGIREALRRLRGLNDVAYGVVSAEEEDGEGAGGGQEVVMADETPDAATHRRNRRLIAHLERCFAEEARGAIKLYWMSFPSVGNRAFGEAVARRDPVALLILMHWAVIPENLSYDAWWAESVGRRIVAESAEVLRGSEVMELPGFRDAVAWTRRMVGLEELA